MFKVKKNKGVGLQLRVKWLWVMLWGPKQTTVMDRLNIFQIMDLAFISMNLKKNQIG